MAKKMNRKQFIQSHGAISLSWIWSWSFIHKKKKLIIFGYWKDRVKGNKCLLLSEQWRFKKNGHRHPGYRESLEHIRLIREEGYELKIFEMTAKDHSRPSKIKSFKQHLESANLLKSNGKTEWCVKI